MLSCSACRVQDVRDVQEAVLILVLLVDAAHECCCWRQHLVDEDEYGLLWRQLDSFADDIDELAYCEVGGHQVLLLVDRRDV